MERETWACHGVVGHYTLPAMNHCRNCTSCMPETRGTRTANTIAFFLDKVEIPKTSATHRLARVAEYLVQILQQPHPATSFLQQGTIINDEIKK